MSGVGGCLICVDLRRAGMSEFCECLVYVRITRVCVSCLFGCMICVDV